MSRRQQRAKRTAQLAAAVLYVGWQPPASRTRAVDRLVEWLLRRASTVAGRPAHRCPPELHARFQRRTRQDRWAALLRQRLEDFDRPHLPRTWAGGWRCWLCTTWSDRPLRGRCGGSTSLVSLSLSDSHRLQAPKVNSWSTHELGGDV
jgi:hypothetical protein